jgi:predicted transcriptional regulator
MSETDAGDDTGRKRLRTRALNETQAEQGETIGGTTDDDLGQVTTTVGTADDTPLQRQIKTDHLCHPDASHTDIADRVGCSPAYVQQTLCSDDGHYFTREEFADLSPVQQQIIELAVNDNGLKQCEIAARLDVSDPYVSLVLSHNEHIVAAIEGGELDR